MTRRRNRRDKANRDARIKPPRPKLPEAVPCPCGKQALATTGATIYPHRPDLRSKRFYRCECGRRVGCHPDGTPLGVPADEATRRARNAAHAAFDPIWRRGEMPRAAAYWWLTTQLGAERQVHIGEMTREQAELVVEVCRNRTRAGPGGAHELRTTATDGRNAA